MVSTQDSESCNPSSNLGGTFFLAFFVSHICPVLNVLTPVDSILCFLQNCHIEYSLLQLLRDGKLLLLVYRGGLILLYLPIFF